MNYFSRYRSTKSFGELSDEAKSRARAFLTKAFRGAPAKRLSAADRRFLRRLAGAVDPLGVLLASDGRAKYRVMCLIYRQQRDLLRQDPTLEFLFVTILDQSWETSDEQTVIQLDALKAQARRVVSQITADWIGVVEVQAFSNVRHPAGGKVVSPHAHLVLWGHDIEGVAYAVADSCNKRMRTSTAGVDAVNVERINPTNLDMARVVRYLFKSPDRCKNLYFNPRTSKTNLNESEAGDRYIRYFRMFQILSLIQIDQLVFGSGDGARIRAAVLRDVHDWRERRTGRVTRAVVMAEIEGFWAELMPRLGHHRFHIPHNR